MRIKEIEQYFQTEDILDKVLEFCKKDFDKIDYYAGIMKDDITDNPAEARKALNELTGVFMSLKIVLATAETEKKNREIRYYNQKRIEVENSVPPKKFVSAPTEKEASVHVASYRRVLNIVRGYVEATEKAISTLQSILKYLASENTVRGNNEV